MAEVWDIDLRGIEILDQWVDQFPRQVKEVLNTTLRRTKSLISTKIRETYNIARSTLNESRNLTIIPATIGNLQATIIGKGRRIPLIEFTTRSTGQEITARSKKRVTILVRKDRAARVLLHEFIAQMQSGHKGIFIRRGPKILPTKGYYRLLGIKRQKIYERFTISIGQMMNTKNIFESATNFSHEFFREELIRRLDVFIKYGK